MATAPSLASSHATTPTDKLRLDEASRLIRSVLRDGPETIKAVVKLIQDQDRINPEPLYRREAQDLTDFLEQAGFPHRSLPTWEQVDPNASA